MRGRARGRGTGNVVIGYDGQVKWVWCWIRGYRISKAALGGRVLDMDMKGRARGYNNGYMDIG